MMHVPQGPCQMRGLEGLSKELIGRNGCWGRSLRRVCCWRRRLRKQIECRLLRKLQNAVWKDSKIKRCHDAGCKGESQSKGNGCNRNFFACLPHVHDDDDAQIVV